MIGLQNFEDEIAEKFDPAPKEWKKKLLYAFLFLCRVYITISHRFPLFSAATAECYKWEIEYGLCACTER